VGALLLAGSEVSRLAQALSTGRPVTATAQQTGNEATRVVDGDITTRWSANGFPQSVTVDLGGLYRASNVHVVPYLDRAYQYRVQASTDGSSWTTVVDRTTNTTPGSAYDSFSSGTRTMRYARLTVTGVAGATTNWVSIQEFAVHDRYDPRANLALSKPVTATSSQTANPARNATDGSSGTAWGANAVPTSAAPQQVTVDLQATTAVDTVRVFSRSGSGPKAVSVQGSVNGTSWTTLATATLPNAEGPHLFLFPSAQARWIRLRTTSSYSTTSVQVEELEVFAAH
jgi:hypothetical protein